MGKDEFFYEINVFLLILLLIIFCITLKLGGKISRSRKISKSKWDFFLLGVISISFMLKFFNII